MIGIFYGIGYCPLTDWHWEVLEKLGMGSEVNSYIQYLIDRLFDIHISARAADIVTFIAFFVALILSVFTNFFMRYFPLRKKKL